MPQVYLSVVIPAYNEEPRIGSTLERVIEYLGECSYTWEVVVADDGSTDATAQLVGQVAAQHPQVHLLSLAHRGKGWAVKHGMLHATGRFRLLCDADLSVPIEQVERLLPPRCQGADVAVGSREAPGARRIGEPQRRHLMGRVYNSLVRLLAVPGLKDTQCGFKCFRGEIAVDLFNQQTIDGFAFDVELLFLSRKLGLAVQELGIDWYYREHSKVRPIRDSIVMTYDLIKMRLRHLGKGQGRQRGSTPRQGNPGA